MTSPHSSSVLLGSTERLPFLGHFKLRIECANCEADLAGRIGTKASPEEAWELACFVREALLGAQGDDALSLTRSCWEKLLVLPRPKLGSAQGKDLSLMVVAHDSNSTTLSAVGLDGIWQVDDTEAHSIAGLNNPETSHPGIPQLPPKVLNLAPTKDVFLGACLKETPQEASREGLLKRTGVAQ